MRIQSLLVRAGLLSGLALSAYLIGLKPARAEVTLVEKDGWGFFIDGRVNSFLSVGQGDGFPQPSGGADNGYSVQGAGSPFTAGFETRQETAAGRFSATLVRSGFLGSVIAFGMKRQLTSNVTVKGYMSLWGTSQSYARDRSQDFGGVGVNKGPEVRDGWIAFDGPFGTLVAGRQGGILGGISTEIDFLYGHNFGLGLPCLDIFYAACGHIGTGALGNGNAAGFAYTTPSIGGLQLKVALYDPVRLLGAVERVPFLRPEGTLSFARKFSEFFALKLAVEAMWQKMGFQGEPASKDQAVWGVAGGGRFEIGPIRLGLSAFRGEGLGLYVALQNSPATFNEETKHFRTFTGVYGQSAVVFGKEQISFGAGRVTVDLIPPRGEFLEDSNPGKSIVKSQMGISAAFYHHLTDNLVVGIDYFRFQTNWWGALSLPTADDPMPTGRQRGEQQVVHFVNAGTTFVW